jgi:hypothetical protein
MVTSRRVALFLTLVLGAAACRQADGQAPAPTDDQKNEIGDIARDMVNLVNRDPEAPADLRSDLAKYAPDQAASAQIGELASALSAALAGARLEEPTAQQLAQTLWMGVAAREFSDRQVTALQDEVKAVLASAGVPAERAQPVADRLGDVQKAVTDNPRRWYQMF